MKKLLKIVSVFFILAFACNVGYASSSGRIVSRVGDIMRETGQVYEYTVVDPDTQQVVAELRTIKPTGAATFAECGSMIIESQRRVDNGEASGDLTVELPNPDNPFVDLLIRGKDGTSIISSVLVYKTTETAVMTEVVIKLK